jgi:hypothetical protein
VLNAGRVIRCKVSSARQEGLVSNIPCAAAPSSYPSSFCSSKIPIRNDSTQELGYGSVGPSRNIQRIYGPANEPGPLIMCSLVICVFIHLLIIEAQDPSLHVAFRNETHDPPVVFLDPNSSFPQCQIELGFALLHRVVIRVDKNDQFRSRRTAADSLDFASKPISNPLFRAPATGWRLNDAHLVSFVAQLSKIPVYKLSMESVFYEHYD